LTKVVPELNLYDRNWPIWTYQEQLPPAKFVFNNDDRRGSATDSLISGGCIISGSQVTNSVLFSDVRVNSYSTIEDSVILPNVDIGRYVTLKRVVVDKGARIPDGMEIGLNPEQDRKRFHVSDKGITLVTPDMLGQSLHHAR
jgi:glucose-1-phosphate adenylyltransferase